MAKCGKQNANALQATMWVCSQTQNFKAQWDCHYTLGGEKNKTQTSLVGLLRQGIGRTQEEQSSLKSRIPEEALSAIPGLVRPANSIV